MIMILYPEYHGVVLFFRSRPCEAQFEGGVEMPGEGLNQPPLWIGLKILHDVNKSHPKTVTILFFQIS